jgi:hypothetical protein
MIMHPTSSQVSGSLFCFLCLNLPAHLSGQHLLKRQFQLDIGNPVIIGIVAGVVTLNAILLLSWCIVKRRRSKAKQDLISAAFENSAMAATSRLSGALPQAELYSEQHDPAHYQTMHAAQSTHSIMRAAPSLRGSLPPHGATSPRGHTPRQSVESFKSPSLRSKRSIVYSEPDIVPQLPTITRPPKASLAPHGIGMRRGGSVRRRNSADTVSVYSATSAPLDFHDYAFRSLPEEPAPNSAPPWAGFRQGRSSGESGYVWPIRRTPVSSISEQGGESGPETSAAKIYWKTQLPSRSSPRPRYPTISESGSIPPVPSLPESVRSSVVTPPPRLILLDNQHAPSSPHTAQIPLERRVSGSSTSSSAVISLAQVLSTAVSLSPSEPQHPSAFTEYSATHERQDSDSTSMTSTRPPVPTRSPLRGRI